MATKKKSTKAANPVNLNSAWDSVSDFVIDVTVGASSIVGFPVGYPLWSLKKWIKGGDLTWFEAARATANDLKGYAQNSTAGTLGNATVKDNSWFLLSAVGAIAITYFVVKTKNK